jgi:DNA-binding beta-propeller fold protein YncE
MRFLLILCTVILALGPAAPASAEVEWDVVKTLSLEKKPLDVAVSADGKSIYVLLKGGKVQIYSAGGQLQESLDLGFPADSIALSSAGNLLYAASGEKKSVQVVRLEFVQRISTAGSPVKGAKNALVAVAIFNDFQ